MPNSTNEIVLVTDLDHTLIKTDMLYEAFLQLIKANPFYLIVIPFWLLSGKSKLKEEIFSRVEIDPAALPYRQSIIEIIKDAKNKGQKIYLATASHQKIADDISNYLDLFDGVFGTHKNLNLKGKNKAEKLINEFGENSFEYIGDNKADLKIWEKSSAAYVVDLGVGLHKKAEKIVKVKQVIKDEKKSFLKLFIKQIRVYQWVKNLLLFIPALGAHQLDSDIITKIITGFFSFSFIASSVYVTNDLLDLASDRVHPRKKNRPLASGDLSLITGIVSAPLLLFAGFGIGVLFLDISFFITLVIYYVITTLYSFKFKRLVILDILTLASLYTIRIIAGGAAVSVEISPWLLAFSMFFFLSLALVKRYTELLVMKDANKEKASGRGYEVGDSDLVRGFGTASAYISVLVFALYANSEQIMKLYNEPYYFWGIAVLLMYWITRIWFLAHRGKMTDDPIVFTVKDKASWLIGLFIAVIGVLAVY